MRTIELSCDLGEATDAAGRAVEAEIWAMVGAANVACGGHAGDEVSMSEAVERAARHGVRLGAHPSYPDREGFGRRRMTIAPERLRASLVEQMEALRAVARRAGVPLERAKAHGALYNEAVHDEDLAEIIVDAIEAVDARMAIVAQPHSKMIAA
ncbi:MAG TPA: LamB/YcsF family protein, partial [Thermoanaerobaculia bacterium]